MTIEIVHPTDNLTDDLTDENIARVFMEVIQHPSYLKVKKQRIMEDKMSIHATDSTFNTEVLKSELPVIVDFWASWCGPCKAIAPELEKIAVKFSGKIKVVKVDVDENPRTAELYNVKGIPTILFVKNGEIVEWFAGSADASYIENTLTKAFDL